MFHDTVCGHFLNILNGWESFEQYSEFVKYHSDSIAGFNTKFGLKNINKLMYMSNSLFPLIDYLMNPWAV